MKKYFLILLFSALPVFLSAHPHMAIYYSCDFHFQDNELKGAWINFAFDKIFSVDIVQYYDLDKNGIFDEAETEDVYNNAFINLKKYGFFISIREAGGRSAPGEVSDFSARLEEDDVLNYRFYIELEENSERELYLSIFDPSYFCASYMAEDNPVGVIAEPAHQAEFEILENVDNPVYYDPYQPAGDPTVHTEWRPGLNTFFPEEIHLVY